MKKILQITEDIAVYADNLQFIKKTRKGNSENPYYENRYFALLEDCLEDVYRDLVKRKLVEEKGKNLEEAIEVLRNSKREIREEIKRVKK